MIPTLVLAWRNVWRNGRRSLITVVSLSGGLAAIMMGQSLIKTIQLQLIEKATGIFTGDLQVLQAGVRNYKFPEKNISKTAEVERLLESRSEIASFEKRVLVLGLISSKKDSIAVFFVGVEPERDARVTTIREYLKEGSFLKSSKPSIVLGDGLAKALGVKVGDSVVLLSQATDGSMGASNFDVEGIYHTGSQTFDMALVYVPVAQMQPMLSLGDKVNDFVIRLKDPERAGALKTELSKAADGLGVQVLDWGDVDQEIVGIQRYQNAILQIMLLVVFTIVALGILNTLLMSLFERVREFGVLLAIGAKPAWVVRLILLESCLLGAVGVVFGLSVGSALISYYHWTGLKLPIGDTFSYFLPFPDVLFLRFHWSTHSAAIAAVFCTCVLAALFPALRASKLRPAEALRSL